MDSQETADQNPNFFKDIENGINEREEKFIGSLSHQLGSLTETIIQSTLNVASTIDAGFLLELQNIKMKRDVLAEKMKSFNLERIDEVEQTHPPYESPVDHSEVTKLINNVKSIIEQTNNDEKSISGTTNEGKSISETTN
ncbi:hypothetical protein LSTR_LSTR006922 [Laodelphax striatellus]|uniref:Uncharacterized protein n=1 Tax=Laodelphax striatellus TaxID=195883 RepID=A0A482X3K4_LAOST|nr:hypothetical protein LSTR_LSTR006922 [Laodelphax striatellus]